MSGHGASLVGADGIRRVVKLLRACLSEEAFARLAEPEQVAS